MLPLPLFSSLPCEIHLIPALIQIHITHPIFRRIPPNNLLAWDPNPNFIPLIPPPCLNTLYPNGPDPRHLHSRSLSRVWSSLLSRHCRGGGVGCCRCFSCKWFIFFFPFFWGVRDICFSLFSYFWKNVSIGVLVKNKTEVFFWTRDGEGQRWVGGICKNMRRSSKTETRKFQNFISLLQNIHIYTFSPNY